MPRSITRSAWLLGILSSVLYVLSFPKSNVTLLAWVALVPLLLAVLFTESLKRWEAFRMGWASGILAYMGLLYWLLPTYRAAEQPLPLAILSLLLLASYLGLYWGVWAELMHRIRHRQPWLISIFGAASWVALEYARTLLFSGFPWTLLADSQITLTSLIQIASITGVYGVSFLIVLVNMSFVSRTRLLSPLAIVISLVWGASQLRAAPTFIPDNKGISVALLQGNIDQYKKWDEAYVHDIQKQYETLVQEASQKKVNLVVWPETSIPGILPDDQDLFRWMMRVIQSSKTDHLVSAPSKDAQGLYNSSFGINRYGSFLGQYDKTHLVPFGETIPMGRLLTRWISALNAFGGFTAGTRSAIVPSAGVPLGVSICYEAIFPNLVRRSVRDGAQLLVNQTNDGWYLRTSAPYQHWAPNVFRAIENNRYMLRANNTGVTGIIDPWGRTLAASEIFQHTVVYGRVEPRMTLTFYTRHGDAFAVLCALFCIVFFVRVILSRK